ncbi:pseudouridine-5'-phosphate glycosidase [Grimontia sp. AD028]|uniref:Pseudouridine-5'-phosphate glycosidase n=1 Tax=Grimontia indica TaxID=1056512 RepID=R1GRS1_9GAMM|nr:MULTISPECIES: pseudouridine-5'-phosphate glycosidase [Grimontia]EOD78898.1 Pseudouridine 5'-phosphate glycosidase [Grimontia indica]KKD59309.1 pseudouridine-5'-phosphate glycosidase [Grimontia sp. AD028]
MLNPYLDIHPDVQQALSEGKPVVALESTIISHGMPYPENVETALRVEKAVRDNGAIPATIAILKGRLKVGLSEEEITYLGQQGQSAIKTSRRDIPFIVANKADGATTVASTMILADMAGIRVFATGGIGGVHRGAETSFDISADLEELAETKVAVVCAGIKSILDLGLTLEYLETKGVPVIGYGTETLPAFYTRESQFGVDYRIDSPELIAAALKAKWEMKLKGGAVIANPVPEEHALKNEEIDSVIEAAITEMDAKGIKGKDSTPFLLAKVAEKTAGNSLKANIALVLNNAALAAKIAVAYSD